MFLFRTVGLLASLAVMSDALALEPRRGPEPLGQVEPGTTTACTWWYENKDGSLTCQQVPAIMEIPMSLWLEWNPALTKDCGNFKIGYSYCIEVSSSPTTTSKPPTPTTTSTAIITPTPNLPGLADKCYKFHKVVSGDTCTSIAKKYELTLLSFYTNNPYIGNDCGYMPLGTHVCVATYETIPSFQEHGCFSEAYIGIPGSSADDTRALDHSFVRNYPSLTLEWCAIYCMQEQKQSLFGVQYGSQCWCGSKINMGSTKTPATDCNVACTGNSKQTCGGSNRLNIYGASGSTAPPAYRPWGCYTEGSSTRALGVATRWTNDMTVDKCADFCLREKGTSHFDVQNAQECWCGNVLGRGAVPTLDTACDVPCAGDGEQVCGGAFGTMNLYSKSFTRPPVKYRNKGCYADFDTGRILPDAFFQDTKAMTVERCAKYCVDKGFLHFGLQIGTECWCGKELDPHAQTAVDSQCTHTCPGNRDQKCGGSRRLNVYQWD